MYRNLPIYTEVQEIQAAARHDELAHWHDSIELVRMIDGRAHCIVDQSDFLLKKGDICLINRRHMHRVFSAEKSASRREILFINPSYFAHNKEIFDRYIRPMAEDTSFSHVRFANTTKEAVEIDHLIDQILLLEKEKPAGYDLEITGLTCLILRRLFLLYTGVKFSSQSLYDPDLFLQEQMTAYIYAHYAEKLSLADIAASGNVSRSTCARLFEKYSGKTPIEFLNTYRLEQSAVFLKTTDRTIADIASSCGYWQQSYFTRQFQKEYGVTPRVFRRTCRPEPSALKAA